MKELTIYKFQAENIENTLRLIANYENSKEKKTCLDRDIMQSLQWIRNCIAEKHTETVYR